MTGPLSELAHARAGDKGRVSMVSVVCYDAADFEALSSALTPERVSAHLATARSPVSVERFVMPHLGAFNFVIQGLAEGGVTRSLALDAHGKSLSSLLLTMEIERPDRS